jgi:N-acetylglucosaminyldiphosphoundecaprenol N-acetyl-beta-D-mannosaminyltransferase
MRFRSFDFLGIRLHAMTKHDIVGVVAKAVDQRVRCIIGYHNLHSLYVYYHESKMREFYSSADYIHIDGLSLVLLGRLFGLPFKSEHRTGYLDLMPLLAEEARRSQWRIFYLGSRPGVAEKAARTLRGRYPGLLISTSDGHFDTDRSGNNNQSVLAEIRAYGPDILMVGMGMPRQENWIMENQKDVATHAIFCCGALMDYIAGEVSAPPRWLGPLGVEWLYRLLSEPTRLWRRYLVEPWFILFQMTKQLLRNCHSRTTSRDD